MSAVKSTAIALGLGLILSGCAGVTSLYKTPDRGYLQEKNAAPPTIQEALKYTDDWIDAYRDALGNNARFETYAGATFLLLSAGAIGNNVTSGSMDGTTWMGLTAATTWGLGNLLTNRPKLAAYVAGTKALACVKSVVSPLQAVAVHSDNLESNLSSLSVGIQALRAVSESDRSKVGISPTLLVELQNTLTEGSRLQAKILSAGNQTIAHVDEITADVDLMLSSLSPNLDSVIGILDSVKQLYSGFSTSPAPVQPPGDGVGAQSAAFQMNQLRSAVGAAGEIRRLLTLFAESLPASAFEKCGVDTENITALSIQGGDSITFKPEAGQTESRYITGGSGKYLAMILDAGDEKPDVNQPTPLGPVVTVKTVVAPIEGKKYVIIVRDAVTGKTVPITISVEKPPG